MPLSPIAIDFETFYRLGSKATPSIKSQGTWAYTHDPEFEVLIVSVCDGSSVWAGEPSEFAWEDLRGHLLLSHNAGFDRAVYRRLVEDGKAPAGLDAHWNCTANMAAYLSGGKIRSLKDASKKWLNLDVSKAVRDNLSGKRVRDLKRDGTWEATLRYAEDDVVECIQLWQKLESQWPDVEKEASILTMEHTEFGVAIDQERLHRDIASLQEAIWRTEKVLPWIEKGFKPGSPTGLAEECRKFEIPTPPTKEEDEEGFILWEREYGPRFPWVNAVSRLRSLRKVLSGHEHVKSRIRADGRFDFGLLYFGAHTGRWSGTGGFNMQNLRANPLVVDLSKDGEVIPAAEAKKRKLTKDSGEIRVIDQRALMVPAAGHEMVLVDLAQIEPRLLHWATENDAMLEKVAAGMSVYEAYARVTPADKPVWTDPGEMKKGNPLLYKAIKIQVLQLGYGSGWQTFMAQALDNDLEMDEAGARKVVADFREANPKIVGLWATLQAGLENHAYGMRKEDFEINLPSGRKIMYGDVRRQLQKVEVEELPNGAKISRKRYGFAANVGMKRVFLYGGKLAENLIQAMARDVFVQKLVALRRNGHRVLWSIHDEAVMEIPTPSKPHHDNIIQIFREPVPWIENCPLDAELSVVAHYKK